MNAWQFDFQTFDERVRFEFIFFRLPFDVSFALSSQALPKKNAEKRVS